MNNPLELTSEVVLVAEPHVGFFRLNEGLDVVWEKGEGSEFFYSLFSGDRLNISSDDCKNLSGEEVAYCLWGNFKDLEIESVYEVTATSSVETFHDAYNLLALFINIESDRSIILNLSNICEKAGVLLLNEEPAEICEWLFYATVVDLCWDDASKYGKIKNLPVETFEQAWCMQNAVVRFDKGGVTK